MVGITDEHVEWAVINRLKAMLDEPPKTEFNVTQSFALFSTVLLWTKNRAWVAGNKEAHQKWANQADQKAHDVREALRGTKIVDAPWLLSMVLPQIVLVDLDHKPPHGDRQINSDFVGMSAEAFFKWLRDALAHGDGRTIRPIHKRSKQDDKTLLAGFKIVFAEKRGSNRKLTLALYHADMTRIGASLADLFCKSLSGGDRNFEQAAGTASIEEAAHARQRTPGQPVLNRAGAGGRSRGRRMLVP